MPLYLKDRPPDRPPKPAYDEGVEVTLTIENSTGEQGTVSAIKPTYEEALAAARELIPEGCKAIVIRTDS